VTFLPNVVLSTISIWLGLLHKILRVTGV
jgi:hypothetical protein